MIMSPNGPALPTSSDLKVKTEPYLALKLGSSEPGHT